MNASEKVKALSAIIKSYLPLTDAVDIIHDCAHQEMLRQMMQKVNDELHQAAPDQLRSIMKHCIEESQKPDSCVGSSDSQEVGGGVKELTGGEGS